MLADNEKERIKALFSEYLDLNDSKKELNNQIKDIKDEVAQITSMKKTVITKLFSFLKSKYENGTDELDDLVTLSEELGE